MSLERFTRKKVVVADPDTSVANVALEMRTRHVGAVVIARQGRPVGIVTDRDLALRVVGEGLLPNVAVAAVMSQELVTARVDASLDDAFFLMQRNGVRRLPIVTDDGSLVGMVAIDDLVVLLAGELTSTAGVVSQNRGP
jgi:CBS domain-containing protein